MSNFENIYNSPIETHLRDLKPMMAEVYGHEVMKVVGQIGIEIDKEGLIQALSQDKIRYEKAYQDGWNDCDKYYKDIIEGIRKEVSNR